MCQKDLKIAVGALGEPPGYELNSRREEGSGPADTSGVVCGCDTVHPKNRSKCHFLAVKLLL